MKYAIILVLCLLCVGCTQIEEPKKEYLFISLDQPLEFDANGSLWEITGKNSKTENIETWVFDILRMQRASGYGLDMVRSIFYNGQSKQLFLWIDADKEYELKKEKYKNMPIIQMSPPDAYIVRSVKQINREGK